MEKAFCVFEGGGAKGVAHVGTLRAIEETDGIDIKGYAGTSAGAVVACLAAAGYSSEELLKFRGERPINSPALEAIGRKDVRSLAELFGKEWKHLSKIRELNSKFLNSSIKALNGAYFTAATMAVLFTPLIYLMFRSVKDIFPRGSFWQEVAWMTTPLIIWAPFLFGVVYLAHLSGKVHFLFKNFEGYVALNPVIDILDELLWEKFPSLRNQRRVTFSDIKRETGNDLKVVATDLHSGTMVLFDRHGYQDLAVTDAVAASSAIPIVFKPIRIGGSQYCDGGLVSNLPAWTFDSERLLETDALVISSQVSVTSGSGKGGKRGIPLLDAIARSAVFGASELNTRGIHHHVRLELKPDLGLLSFEDTRSQAAAIINSLALAKVALLQHVTERQSAELIRDLVASELVKLGHDEQRLRVALVRDVRLINQPAAAFEVWARAGFEDDHDGNMLLSVSDSLVGASVKQKKVKYLDLTLEQDRNTYRTATSRERADKVLPTDRQWVISLPIDRETPDRTGNSPDQITAAVTIDGACDPKGKVADIALAVQKVIEDHTVFYPYKA